MALIKLLFLILAFNQPAIATRTKSDTTKQKLIVSHQNKNKISNKNSTTYWNRQMAIQRAHKKFYSDCVFTNQYSIAQRLNRYPFKHAAKILAVSYNGGMEPNRERLIGDTVIRDTFPTRGLYFKNDTLVRKTIFEIRELSRTNIIELTRIIFNTANKVEDGYPDLGANCFNPGTHLFFTTNTERYLTIYKFALTA